MKTRPNSTRRGITNRLLVVSALASLVMIPSMPGASAARKNPASMLYVTEVGGEALIDTGEAIDDLAKRSVYTAQGSVIETKRAETGTDQSKNLTAMVFSNVNDLDSLWEEVSFRSG